MDDQDTFPEAQGGSMEMSLHAQETPPLFSCFFYKLSSAKHPNCERLRLTTFSRVQQHVKRRHLMGEVGCTKCRRTFNTYDQLNQHIQQYTCHEANSIESGILLPEEYKSLRSLPGNTDREKWYLGFARLFPHFQLPTSPFIDTADAVIRHNAESSLSVSGKDASSALGIPQGLISAQEDSNETFSVTNNFWQQAAEQDALVPSSDPAGSSIFVETPNLMHPSNHPGGSTQSVTKAMSEAIQTDSGFVSHSTKPSDPLQDFEPDRQQPMSFYSYRQSPDASLSSQENEDAQSVWSIDESIASSIESNTTSFRHQEAAVEFIARKFIEDPTLLSLYEESVRRLDQPKFVRNHARLLKAFYLGLLPNCMSPSQTLAVRFLRARSRRTLISCEIWRLVSDSGSRETIPQLLSKEQDSLFTLERFLRNEDAAETEIEGNLTIGHERSDVDSDSENDELLDVSDNDAFSKLEETGQFLTGGLPFEVFKDSVSEFLHSKAEEHSPQAAHSHNLSGSPTGRNLYSRLMCRVRRALRPRPKTGFRRIEWTCDCGSDLYADFAECEGGELNELEHSLQSSGANATQTTGVRPDCLSASGCMTSGGTPAQHGRSILTSSGGMPGPARATGPSSQAQQPSADTNSVKFLALCVNTGGMYKTLTEINTTQPHCDACAFLQLKNAYLGLRGQRSLFWLFVKPTTVEFVQFTVWDLRHGYISICSRPDSIPPQDLAEYEYTPKPLKSRPPMPPEVFIHYLNHNHNVQRCGKRIWIPRLPKRLSKRVIDDDEGCLGWGIHVIEGPNREVLGFVMMMIIFGSIVAAVTWAIARRDVPGGATLGAFLIAVPGTSLGTFLFFLGLV
ncbi:hypothetical protein FDECE_13641 [Fusarium decemcellulare]|nr:hypothetical protein FDECE_13641 [Fusarium decemcellulare]